MHYGLNFRFLPVIALVYITQSQVFESNGVSSTSVMKPNGLYKVKRSLQVNGSTNSEEAEMNLFEPPLSWTEHWYRHDQQLHRMFLHVGTHVAVYFDRDGDSGASWVYSFVSQVWSYMVQTYGAFGPDPYISLIVHKSRYPGCHMGYSLDPRNIHDKRNVLDCGSFSPNDWLKESYRKDTRDMIINYLAYFVEVSSKQRWGSPSPADYVWKEYTTWKTAWVDIFTYDVYIGLNMTAHAKRYLIAHEKKGVKNPREFTFWLRDWFLPIYNHNFGGPRVLNEYFELLGDYFTQYLYNDRITYSGKLNMGQFVHFWSAAARRDLTVLAQGAFGWNATYEQQLDHARIEYPEIYELYNGIEFADPTTMIESSISTTQETAEPIILDSNNDTTKTTQYTVTKADAQSSENNATTPSNANHVYDTAALPVTEAPNSGRGAGFGENPQQGYMNMGIITAFSVIFVLLVIAIAYVVFYKRKIQNLQIEIVGLTNQEVKEFFDGDPNMSSEEAYAMVQSMPFVKDFEILRSQLILAEDKIIGSGQFGRVIHGHVNNIERTELFPVAVKTVKPDVDVLYFKAILSEAKIMAFLGRHTNIVRLVATCTANIKNREIFIALELCPLGDLHKFLRNSRSTFQNLFTSLEIQQISSQSPLPAVKENELERCSDPNRISTLDLIKFAHDISNAMMYLTDKRVIHADLAARNVLLTANCVAQISDFGLSRQLLNYANYKKTTQAPLPWRWMAVESLKDMKFSIESDVWAFGVTLWEIFTLAETPYPGWTWDHDFVDKLVSGIRPKFPTYANQTVYDLIQKCWKLEPSERLSFSEVYCIFGEIIGDLLNSSEVNALRHYIDMNGVESLAESESPV